MILGKQLLRRHLIKTFYVLLIASICLLIGGVISILN
jgi:hypothetical protein